MGDDPVYTSRLAGRAQGPTRGMGSAFPQNQRVAGANDPDAAAKMAGMDPEAARSLMEESQRLDARMSDLRAELLTSSQEGNAERWCSLTNVTPEWLAQQPPGDIERMHAKMVQSKIDAADDDDEDHLRETMLDSLNISPDDPLYDPIMDRKRKKRIQALLEPLDFEKMVFEGFVDQDIPLREGKFTLTYRTISTQHGLWMERMLMNLGDVSVQYGRHWFSLLQVAISLQTVNGRSIGPDLSKLWTDEQFKDFKTALTERMKFLGKMPGPLTDDLIVQYTWFVGRVRKLLAGNLAEKVGNS